METEHIVETNTTTGEPTARTTIIRDSAPAPKSRSGLWIGLLAVIVLAVVAFVALQGVGEAEIAKDDAVAEAAGSVGNAADNIGAAANDVGAAVEETVDSVAE